ncbi:hypothetical protein PUN28_018882 [Cardiocondyla obscurior]|uniref:Uncharacterized protein n=1 Tax=Cardiocondyla obscurior TaxID=286306 RepID=A0AAW2ECG5_9HYME
MHTKRAYTAYLRDTISRQERNPGSGPTWPSIYVISNFTFYLCKTPGLYVIHHDARASPYPAGHSLPAIVIEKNVCTRKKKRKKERKK